MMWNLVRVSSQDSFKGVVKDEPLVIILRFFRIFFRKKTYVVSAY